MRYSKCGNETQRTEFRPEYSKKTVVKFNHCFYKLAKVSEQLQMSVYILVNVFVECAVLNDFYLSDTHPSTCITQEKDEREIHGCYVGRSSKEARRNWKGPSGEARVWAFQTVATSLSVPTCTGAKEHRR
ncbi:uncharacterized protein LOC122529987 [Frieseomelitta varia]|uniref:uncharacterized protein LOC122529987 n=1 Tax=Frieseomelitta varia TaxID=561572 RepID=UPI001CB6875B|nr:uncharacterized protein LOC122529987 [Frieseomelitta varia]